MTNAAATAERSHAQDRAEQPDGTWSQYVTFAADERLDGVEITKVREIKG